MKRVLIFWGICALSACYSVSQNDLRASRAFSGPSQFPPSGFAGYGILVFPAQPSQNPERFRIFCEAYLSSLLSSTNLSDLGVPVSDQMVTILPVSSNEIATELSALSNNDACKRAVDDYDLAQALNALKKAEGAADLTDGLQTLSGRGPFLLAWAPGVTFGSQDALVLAADLSNSSSQEQANADMLTWRKDIETAPEKWRKGWNIEGVRLLVQRWVDRRGAAIVKLIGDWG